MGADENRQVFTRRAVLVGAISLGGGAAAALPAAVSASLGAGSQESEVGEVVDVEGESVGVLVARSSQVVRARSDAGERGFRRGDRVVLARDPGAGIIRAAPLYSATEGSLDSVATDHLSVDGVQYRIDPHSLARARNDETTRPIADVRAQTLRPGTKLGLLCVENRVDNSKTVDTAYVL